MRFAKRIPEFRERLHQLFDQVEVPRILETPPSARNPPFAKPRIESSQ